MLRQSRDNELLEMISSIKSEHPLWGYRRIWAYLRYRDNVIVGQNRVYRIMKQNNLLVTKNYRLKATRSNHRPKPRANKLNEYWGMDMTKILFPSGWWYLHVVKDWYSKDIIGWSFGMTSTTQDWMEALDMAVNDRYPAGIHQSSTKPSLITDNGCQPTSRLFMENCSLLGIKQIFTSWNNPKGNADTERVIRTIKEDLVWVRDYQSAEQFRTDFEIWVHKYNCDFPHMALGWKTPEQFKNNILLQNA